LTSAGAIVSIAALSTAATPAAPATLVPALIGLVSAFGSIFKQIYDLDAEAETVARFIMTSVDALKVKWRDKEGAWNRKTFKAREVATAFSEAVSQGWSEFVVPSLGSVQSKCDLLRNKCKGLEVRAKKLGETFDEIMKALNSAELVIKHNYTFSIELGTQGFALQRNLEKLEEARRQSQQEFEKAFDVLAKLNGRISFAMAVYSAYKPRIDEAVEVLGTKDINKAVTVITQLGMIGVGLSSAPSIVAEDITYAMSAAASFTDLCREYGPEVIEKFKKKK
jgi:hypothetical protein